MTAKDINLINHGHSNGAKIGRVANFCLFDCIRVLHMAYRYRSTPGDWLRSAGQARRPQQIALVVSPIRLTDLRSVKHLNELVD